MLLRNALTSKTIRCKNLFRNSDFFIYAMNVMRDFDLEILIRYENLSVKDSRVKQAEEAFLVDALKRNSWVGSDVNTPDLFFDPVRDHTPKIFHNGLISYRFRVIFNGAKCFLPVSAGDSVITVV